MRYIKTFEKYNNDIKDFLNGKDFINKKSKMFIYHGTSIPPNNFVLRDDYEWEDSNDWSGDLPEGYLFLSTDPKESSAHGKYIIPCELKRYDHKYFNVNTDNPSKAFDMDYGIDLNQKLLNCSSSGQGGGASFTSTSYISMTGFTIIRVILLEPMTILFSGNRALPNNGGRCKSRVYVNGAAVDTEHWNVSSTSITYTDNNGAFTAKSDVTSIGYNYVELKKAMGSGTGLEWWSQLLFSIKG
jgi:hypothetical protein